MISFTNMSYLPREVENSLNLGDIPAENYIPEVFNRFEASSFKECKIDRNSIIRPKILGSTELTGIPSIETPVMVKNIIDPYVMIYDVNNKANITADLDPLIIIPDHPSDCIVYRNGQWGIDRKYCLITLTESAENIFVQPDRLDITPLPFPPANNGHAISTHTNIIGLWNTGINVNGCCSFDLLFNNIDEYRTYAKSQQDASTPIKIWYELETPFFKPVPEWNGYGKIDPITVNVSITKPDLDVPTTPNNIATITGVPISTVGYTGKVLQFKGEMNGLPNGIRDIMDGTRYIRNIIKLELTGDAADGVYHVRAELPNDSLHQAYLVWPPTSLDYKRASFSDGILCNYLPSEGNDTAWWSDTPGVAMASQHNAILVKIPKSIIPNWDNAWTDGQKIDAFRSLVIQKKSEGNPITFYLPLTTPVVSSYNLDTELSPGTYAMESFDYEELGVDITIDVLPNSSTYGNRVYPYKHERKSNINYLSGIAGATEISFIAESHNCDKDSWIINGVSSMVTYADGQEILPTAIVKGDSIKAILERPYNTNLLTNCDFANLINDNGLLEYSNMIGYSINNWYNWDLETTVAIKPGYIELSKAPGTSLERVHLVQFLNPAFLYAGTYTITIEVEGGCVILDYYDNLNGAYNSEKFDTKGEKLIVSHTFSIEKDSIENKNRVSIICCDGLIKIYKVQLEPGSQFTGWKWLNILKLSSHKPFVQPNEIINGDLRYPVNQMGQAVYTKEGYGVDMWYASPIQTVTLNNGTCIIVKNDGDNYGIFETRIENPQRFAGKTVTVAYQAKWLSGGDVATSVKANNLTIVGTQTLINKTGDTVTITFDMPKVADTLAVCFICQAKAAEYMISRVKLEPGSRFTGWGDHIPGTALTKCARYQVVSSQHYIMGIMYSDHEGIFLVPTSTPIRATPVVNIITNGDLYDSTGKIIRNNFIFTVIGIDAVGLKLKVELPAGVTCSLGFAALRDFVFLFDANL